MRRHRSLGSTTRVLSLRCGSDVVSALVRYCIATVVVHNGLSRASVAARRWGGERGGNPNGTTTVGIPSTRNLLGIPSSTSQSDGSVEYSTRRNVTSMEFHSSQYEYSYNVITSSVRLRKDFHHRGCGAADGAERVARHDARSARGAQTHLCPASSRQTTHFRLRLLTTVPQAVLPPHPPLRHRTPRRSPCVLLLLLSRA